MKGPAVAGLDCGTSAVKAVIWDAAGKALGEGRAPLRIESPQPSWQEQDADSWLGGSLAALAEALRDAEKNHGLRADEVMAVCISHQRETFVPVDGRGKALRKALLWMDGRAGPLLPELRQRIGEDRFRGLTGKALSGNLSLCKIEWLRREESETFTAARAFLDVQAFVLHGLTGRAATGWGSADPMGMFDMRSRRWSPELLAGIGLDSGRLPETLEPGAVAGTLASEAAKACGLKEGIPVVIGLGDGQSAGLGCGIAGSGESYLSLGTSIVSGTFSPVLLTGKEFRVSFGGIPGSYFLETVILGGAYTVEWFNKEFGAENEEARKRMAREAESIPAGSEGLMLVPYWSGAMNPYWDSGARGITIGWSGIHGRAHFYRAILEGTAFEQRLHTDGVAAALARSKNPAARIERYVVSGGGAENGLWLRILASVSGREVQRSRAREAGALGAGMLAAAAVGLHPSVEAAARAMSARDPEIISPDPEDGERYQKLYDIYLGLYPALAESLARLTSSE
jgi:xylulokinase